MFVNCLNFFSANQSGAFDFCVVCVSSWIQESDDNSSTRCTFVLSKYKLQLPEPYSICQRNSTGRIHDEWQTWKFVLRHITYVGCFKIFVVVEVWRNLSWSRHCHAESKFNKFLFYIQSNLNLSAAIEVFEAKLCRSWDGKCHRSWNYKCRTWSHYQRTFHRRSIDEL